METFLAYLAFLIVGFVLGAATALWWRSHTARARERATTVVIDGGGDANEIARIVAEHLGRRPEDPFAR